MNKFIYEKGDIEIAENQCAFCIYNRKDTPFTCEKYKEKPQNVLQNKVRCPLAKDTLSTPWQE